MRHWIKASALSCFIGLCVGTLDAQTWSRASGDQDYSAFYDVEPFFGSGHIGVGSNQDSQTLELRGLAQFLTPEGWETWRSTYGQSGISASFRNLAVLGHVALIVGRWDDLPWIVALDSFNGDILWQMTTSDWNGMFNEVRATHDGGFIATGWVSHPTSGDKSVLVTRGSVDGSFQWQKRFGGFSSDSGTSVHPLSSGGFAVAGQTHSYGAGSGDIWLLRLDDFGQAQWARTYGTPSRDVELGTWIAETSEGNLLLSTGFDNLVTLAVDPEGDILWQQGLGPGHVTVRRMKGTPDDGCIITGTVLRDGEDDVWLVKMDRFGNVEWQRALGGDDNDWGFSVAPTESGGFVVGAHTHSYSFGPGRWAFGLLLDRQGRLSTSCPIERDASVPSFQPDFATIPTAWTSSTHFTPMPTTATRLNATSSAWGQCENLCRLRYGHFGEGLSGSGGITPEMLGGAGWCTGGSARIDIEGGLGGAMATLLTGFQRGDFPFRGGHIWIDITGPFYSTPLVLGGRSGFAGEGHIGWSLNEDLTPFLGYEFLMQTLILDPGAVEGMSMTAGMSLRPE